MKRYSSVSLERELIVGDSNERLRLYLDNPSARIAVVFCHGFTGSGTGAFSDPLAEYLSKKYFVCRFDFRGQGSSEGAFIDSSITRELEDLGCVMKHIRKEYNPKRVILLGHSFGAAIATLYAAEHSVDGLISVSGEGDLLKAIPYEFSNEQLEELEQSGSTKVGNWSKDGELDVLGKQFLDDMYKYSTSDSIKAISCPKLFIHGVDDEVIPHSASEEFFELATEPKEFVSVDGADHCYNIFGDGSSKVEELAEYIVRWLERFS